MDRKYNPRFGPTSKFGYDDKSGGPSAGLLLLPSSHRNCTTRKHDATRNCSECPARQQRCRCGDFLDVEGEGSGHGAYFGGGIKIRLGASDKIAYLRTELAGAFKLRIRLERVYLTGRSRRTRAA